MFCANSYMIWLQETLRKFHASVKVQKNRCRTVTDQNIIRLIEIQAQFNRISVIVNNGMIMNKINRLEHFYCRLRIPSLIGILWFWR